MTVDLAIEYIPRRMNELGIGADYYMRFRHFVLQGTEQVKIAADNQYFILVGETSDVRVVSDFGLYDLTDLSANEQDYEHQGTITINNHSKGVIHLRFIQVIPKN